MHAVYLKWINYLIWFIKYSKNEHNAELKHSIGGVGAKHVRTTGDGYFWNQKAHYIHYQWS